MKVRYSIFAVATTLLLGVFLQWSPAVRGQSFFPKQLGGNVNAQCPDVKPVLSYGGDTLFFNRIDHAENRYGAFDSQDIWMSVKQPDGTWSKAERLPNNVNITRYNAILGALADGKTFLISGIFDAPGKQWLRRGFSFITLENGQWGAPVRIRVPMYSSMSVSDLADASMTSDGKYLFMSFASCEGSSANKLYVSVRDADGDYSRPRKLKGPMNKFYSLEAPYYSEADSCLYFAAKQKNVVRGDYNIYSVRPVKYDGKMVEWTGMRCLSDTINTTSWESYFSPHRGGTYAMVCSDNAGMGRSDIFKVMLVEERPWVEVHGRVLNSRTKQLMPMEKDPEVLVNGEHTDSVLMDIDKATFIAFMPLGNRYEFTARAPYYTSDTVVVDVSADRLFSQRDIDLSLTSVPYVTVTGRMMNNLSLSPIPSSHKPVLYIDGNKVDSVTIDAAKSEYRVNLPFGRKYTLSVKAIEYQSVNHDLDLTPYEEYGSVAFDVFAKPLNANMVTLAGRLINTKTGSPLEPGIEAKMKVNRVFSDAFKYNTKNATYTMMLPAGSDYDLVPSVHNFYNKLEVVDLRNAKPRTKVQRDFYVTPLEIGQSVDIENIYFETGKSKLKPESFRSLNALVEFFQEYPNVKVEIGGHTDNVGGAAMNKRLSKARARSVADYMISQGIGAERFQAVGYGPDKPKASNKTAAGRAKNRRVDFTIMGL